MIFLKNIIGYAEEEGCSIYGNCIFSNGLKLEIIELRETLAVYLNDNQKELYLVSSHKECVNFCLILSSLLSNKRLNSILEKNERYK